jgi:hypothetical protein
MTTKPNIELKNIRVLTSMSQETHCYEATLWVDGERWGTVGNAGHGGCDDVHLEKGRDLQALEARIKATFEPYQGEGMTLEYNLELVCGDLVDAYLAEKEYKRILKKPVFINEAGEVRNFTMPKGWTLDKALPVLRAKYPEKRFLNDLPFAEAVAAMKAVGL